MRLVSSFLLHLQVVKNKYDKLLFQSNGKQKDTEKLIHLKLNNRSFINRLSKHYDNQQKTLTTEVVPILTASPQKF